MKAAFLLATDSVKIREVPEPKARASTDVIVEVDAFGACMVDFEIIRGRMKTKKLPIILGHEGSGIVIFKGPDVDNVERGARVLIDPNLSDLTCPQCLGGFSNLCENGGLMGREVDGVFRERLALPSRNVYPLPSGIPAEISPLIQPLSTVIHALRRVDIVPGATVLVLGLGVTGLMFAQLAKLKGARVIATSGIPQRLNLARKLGVDIIINKSETDLATEIDEATNGECVDVILDSTGYRDLLQKRGIGMVKPHGTILLYATRGSDLTMDSSEAYRREIAFKTSRSSLPQDFEDAISLVNSKQIDLSSLASRNASFDQLSNAISFFEDRVEIFKDAMTMTSTDPSD